MRLLVEMCDVEALIISAIESTDTLHDNWNGPQSEVWDKVYAALKLLRETAVVIKEEP